jgi:hypothetical protein
MELTVCRRCSQCRHGAKIVIPIVELHGIHHHGCSLLGRRYVVGAEAPAAVGSGEPRSIVAIRHQEGGGVVGGWQGTMSSWRELASGTWEYGFM